MWFMGVEVEQETSAPPPKKNPGSAPVLYAQPHQQCGSSYRAKIKHFQSLKPHKTTRYPYQTVQRVCLRDMSLPTF